MGNNYFNVLLAFPRRFLPSLHGFQVAYAQFNTSPIKINLFIPGICSKSKFTGRKTCPNTILGEGFFSPHLTTKLKNMLFFSFKIVLTRFEMQFVCMK